MDGSLHNYQNEAHDECTGPRAFFLIISLHHFIRFRKHCWLSSRHRISSSLCAMASATVSSSLIFSASSCNCKRPSPSLPTFYLSSSLALSSRSLSLFAFPSSSFPLLYPISKRSSFSSAPSSSSSSFNVVASAKKKVLIINTDSGGHAIIGFYFAKQLLGSGHDATVLTVGKESSDKMKKPPFSRFSVKILYL